MKKPRIVTAAIGVVVAVSSVGAAGAATGVTRGTQASAGRVAATSSATTTKVSENTKLNRVRTPKLRWFNCYNDVKCATVKAPLDYDRPTGATTTIAVLRTPATGRRIGTLFVNPGGPGGSSTEFAAKASQWLPPHLLAKFDVVGVDPRGIGFSDAVQCLPVSRQYDVYKGLNVGIPLTAAEESGYARSMKEVARSCSRNALAKSMSTAEVARDMEMVRRSIGDGPLNYIGFSYGSHLGTTYANMFPNNFRSLVIDGTISPRAWSGTKANQSRPLEFRLDSGGASWRAMDTILTECQSVGAPRCSFADGGDTHARFTALTESLKRDPVTVWNPFTGEEEQITYQVAVSALLSALYSSDAPQFVSFLLTELESMVAGQAPPPFAARSGLERQYVKRLFGSLSGSTAVPRRGFAYDNSLDAFMSVTCTDSRETTKLANYPGYAKGYEARAPHFGRAWLWSTSGCAGDAFTGQDEDAYTGPYNTLTRKAVLIVGNYWDPATPYAGAVQARATLGRSRLISSDSWGHTAFGTSDCVTNRVSRYLISGTSMYRDVTCPAETEMFPVVEPTEPEPSDPTAPVSDVMMAADSPLRAVPGSGTFPSPKVWR
ncbi:alpha/beta hydrolase [Kribbia dieselivorans]|uniref:alpha/beta hydrolase n=1 Tax=Kribbia dieselivorans TaxID=331526 RepID=UPI000837EE49|nr:alpha/beta hydrolase [Kribbia dieselivorans]